MSDIKVEFAVEMKGERCAEVVREALKDMGEVAIDVQQGSVIVQTSRPWTHLQEKIESTGRKVVLCGFGGHSAVAMINTTGSDVDSTPIRGVVRFSTIAQNKAGLVVDGVVDGLAPGMHGIHVHETGDISQGCASVGAHYNPRGSPHGGPADDPARRHAGDLGNIRADSSGRATFRMIEPHLDIWEIIGRAVVLTANEDDLGRGQNEASRISGNSGDRIACGIIARSAGILQNFKRICACDGVTIWDERKLPTVQQTQKL